MWPLTKGPRDSYSGWEGQLALPAIETAMRTKGKQYPLLAVITKSTTDVHQGPAGDLGPTLSVPETRST